MNHHDSSGKLGGLLHRVLRSAADCFPEVEDGEVQTAILDELEAVWRFEHEELSMGLSTPIRRVLESAPEDDRDYFERVAAE